MVASVIPVLGVALNSAMTDTRGLPVGTSVVGGDGNKYILVQASGAVAQYDAVAIDEDGQAAALTKALADAGHTIGFSQVALADNEYAFVPVGSVGSVSVNVLTGTNADVALYTTATAGKLSSTSTSQTQIRGCVAVTANASGSTAAREVIAQNPSAV